LMTARRSKRDIHKFQAEPAVAGDGAEVGQRHRDLGGGGRLNKPLQRSRDE
jgi:hypothetical protein